MNEWWKQAGELLTGPVGGGAAGSAVAAYLARDTLLQTLARFVFGALAANYLGAPIAESSGLAQHGGAVAFAVGLLALLVLQKITEVLRAVPADGIGQALGKRIEDKLDGGRK